MKLKLIGLSLLSVIIGCNAAPKKSITPAEIGSLIEKTDTYGDYYQYIPSNLEKNPHILVIVHGSLEKGKPAIELAKKFIKRWIPFSEERSLILIAPAFDRLNYQSYGGFRGLFGREIGSDDFVNRLVDKFKKYFPSHEGKFYLYGHSAGGQFGIRYCVRHPNRIIKAVISAPGRYSFPNKNAAWPYGAGRLQRTIKYKDPKEDKEVDVKPDFENYINASELQITILVGASDLEPQPKRPGHRGSSRIDLALNWAEDMNRLAGQNGKTGNISVKIIEGVGHSSRRLTPHCQKYF